MENNAFTLIISLVCMASFIGYTAFMFGVYMRFLLRREVDMPYNHEPISIIIAARNEADNLTQFLPDVLKQDRDLFEVIVINDGSTDNTASILDSFAKEYTLLKVIHLEKAVGKKQALSQAIEAARYDLLLFTDADCKPASKMWAAEMASKFTEGIEIVLGYGAYSVQKGWLNKLIQLDTAVIAARYAGFALWGKPYMGVGRNMAYRKSTWEKANGFSTHTDLPYGDDDLFVMQVANGSNTALCFHPQAFTYSVPPPNFSAWIRQKNRHMLAGKRYKKSISLLLGAEMSFELLFWISGLLTFAIHAWVWFLFLLTFYFLHKVFVLNGIYKTLTVKTKFNFSPILSVVLLFALFLIGINAIFARQVTWKQE